MNPRRAVFLFIAAVAALFPPCFAAAADGTRTFATPPESAPGSLALDLRPSTLRIPPPAGFLAKATNGKVESSPTFVFNFMAAGTSAWLGDNCGTFPEEARVALAYAARLWSVHIAAPTTIYVDACWSTDQGGVLAKGRPSMHQMSSALPYGSTWYPDSLAKTLLGDYARPDTGAMIVFNANPGAPWYFGLDGRPGAGVDFVTAAMNALGHGLGFWGLAEVADGVGRWQWTESFPGIYDRFTGDGAGVPLTHYTVPSGSLADTLQSGTVNFAGMYAMGANGGKGVALNAPPAWAPDASYSYLATEFANTPDALLMPSLAVGAAIHSPGPVTVGMMRDMGWPITPVNSIADTAVTARLDKATASTGRDVVLTIDLANFGPDTADGLKASVNFSTDVQVAWKSPGCVQPAPLVVDCSAGNLAPGGAARSQVAFRPVTAGTLSLAVPASGNGADPDLSNNTASLSLPVSPSPAGVSKQRYRLYSPVTKEHHFTTDLNEYNVLGSYAGTWVQEGPAGKVLDNPGSFGGVAATPYYRLYNTANAQHHWTTDANEYYTLIQFPQYNAEGVDGWLLPTQAAGTIPLYRLMYPYSNPVPGLHHWTIDRAEYDTLIASYGWVGEGGSGFVIP